METCLATTKKSKQGGKNCLANKNIKKRQKQLIINLIIGSKLYQNIKFTSQLDLKFQIWSKPSTSSQ